MELFAINMLVSAISFVLGLWLAGRVEALRLWWRDRKVKVAVLVYPEGQWLERIKPEYNECRLSQFVRMAKDCYSEDGYFEYYDYNIEGAVHRRRDFSSVLQEYKPLKNRRMLNKLEVAFKLRVNTAEKQRKELINSYDQKALKNFLQ